MTPPKDNSHPPFSPWPSFTDEEIDAVARMMRSNRVNYWTGDECRQFEREFAAWSGTEYAVAVTNGTLALELALIALGIGPGDEVIVTPRSFLASASCVVSVGAKPVFADVDANTQNLSAETIRPVLTDATRAVICVHLAGMPCDMDPVMALAEERDLKVIEDCAQAHGATYRGRPVGSIGHIGAWSFCQDKIMTTGGEGGMVTTSNRDWWLRMWSYKDHGKSYEAVFEREHPPGYRWLHESFGSNWRMLEYQAVIGRIQLARMADWRARRAANAERLAQVCARHSVVRVPHVPGDWAHAYYRFVAFVEPEHLAAGWTRDRMVDAIAAEGVPCLHGGCSEIYREKAFDDTGFAPAEPLPVAQSLGRTSITMLVHPTLTDSEMDRACAVLDTVLSAAGS